MSAFGIFAAILTFVYVIYYAVMISMDLFGSKSQQKDNVEVIASLGNKQDEEDVVDETPTFVDEEGGVADTEKAPGGNTNGSGAEEDNTEMSKEDIASSDANELYEEAKALKDQAADLDIRSDADLTADQFEARENILKNEIESLM